MQHWVKRGQAAAHAHKGTRYSITVLDPAPGLSQYIVYGSHQLNNRGHVTFWDNNTGDGYPHYGDSSFLWTGPGWLATIKSDR